MHDALFEDHRVGAGSDVLDAFADDRLSQQGRGGRAVAGDVVGLGGDFFDQLGAHVFKAVFQFDFLGDGHTVIGDQRCAEFLVENDIAAFRAEGDLDGVSQLVDTSFQGMPGIFCIF